MIFETYLHGFQYIVPFEKQRKLFYIVRTLFFGACIVGALTLFAYQASLNIAAYLAFDVATAASFQHVSTRHY
jgi:hypothetical protein